MLSEQHSRGFLQTLLRKQVVPGQQTNPELPQPGTEEQKG
jgi:hypothetical protein